MIIKNELSFRDLVVGLYALWSSTVLAQAPPQQYSRGVTVPDAIHLHAYVRAQNITAQRMALALGAAQAAGTTPAPAPLPACSPQAARFDWRDQHVVTVVEAQGNCGSCWVFATVAALQASYLLANRTPAVNATPTNPVLSEQQVLDCTAPGVTKDSCTGGWHGDALGYLVGAGARPPNGYGTGVYTAQKAPSCAAFHGSMQYTVETWDYVTQDALPSDDTIKAALCAHGPIVSVSTPGVNRALSGG